MHLTNISATIAIVFLFIISSPFPIIQADNSIKSSDLSSLPFHQEIMIPIDTSLPESIYQPIDIRINFEQSCWAKNETQHSVRIAYHHRNEYTEIKSQIYDLSHTDDTHIDSCSIVFIIPEEATGDETYHVLYSNKEESPPDYPDHIQVIDTHYFYEPISGQIMDFDYYQINQDENVIYGICQKGELLGNGMSNSIVKLLPDSKEFASKNAEQIAGFYSSYSINPAGEHTGSQWAEDITKTVLVDGNLMTRIRIKGIAPNNEIETDNIYTYYYNPTTTKRLRVNVNHNYLKDIKVQGNQEREGSLASLSTIKARSGTIDDMNLGEILPKIHFYNEDETIVNYDMPTDPDAHPADWLLGYSDDQDLGSKAWLCINDPETGQAHGLIFDKNTGILEGNHDGIQVKTSVHQHVKLPGLEADSGDLYTMRNAYENGEHLTTLSKGENIGFNVEYIAFQTGGYERVNKESTIFQNLINDCPINFGNESMEEKPIEELERYSLKTTVYNALSTPLGSLLSAAVGKNISYLTAELHKAETLISSGAVGKLKFNSLDIEIADDATLIQKIREIGSLFDFKNSTMLKTMTFNDVEAGTYLIKIYKENPIRYDERQFIGFTIVEVSENMKTRVFCKKQTTAELTVTDQNDEPIENVEVRIVIDDILLSKAMTDEDGMISLPVPLYNNRDYKLQSFYDGFLVDNEVINLNIFNRFRPWKTTLSINQYDLILNIKDTLGLPPGIDPHPTVKSTEMNQETSITAEQKDSNTFQFIDLYNASYELSLNYKSWEYTEPVSLSSDKTIDIVFPAEFKLETNSFNQVGTPIQNAIIRLKRDGKMVEESVKKAGIGEITVPPGTYSLSIIKDENIIAAQKISIKGEKTIDLVSNQPSILHQILPLLIMLAAVGLSVFLYWKSYKTRAIYIIIAFILLTSIFLPWWQLSGENNGVETLSETYMYPPTLITRSQSDTIIGGEISEVPDLFTMVLSIISLILIISFIFIILLTFILDKYKKISWLLTIFILLFLIVSFVLFFITMSEVTKIGIGDFSGSGDISLSLPGESDQLSIPSSWGAGLGFYIVIFSLIGFIIIRFYPLIQKKFVNKN